MREQTSVREQFERTRCDCAICQVPCRHNPGGLDVADLALLCPAGHDVFAWATQHLRALTHKPYPILVPARQANGHCGWYVDGKCAVHEQAPFGCAFFDAHMSEAEVERRYAATVQARKEDAARTGLYYRVWLHLCRRGLIGTPGDTRALRAEIVKLQQTAARQRRRLQKAP